MMSAHHVPMFCSDLRRDRVGIYATTQIGYYVPVGWYPRGRIREAVNMTTPRLRSGGAAASNGTLSRLSGRFYYRLARDRSWAELRPTTDTVCHIKSRLLQTKLLPGHHLALEAFPVQVGTELPEKGVDISGKVPASSQ